MPAAHLANHLLPHVGVRGDVGQLGGVERQTAGLQPLVVTGDAVYLSTTARSGVSALDAVRGGQTGRPARGIATVSEAIQRTEATRIPRVIE